MRTSNGQRGIIGKCDYGIVDTINRGFKDQGARLTSGTIASDRDSSRSVQVRSDDQRTTRGDSVISGRERGCAGDTQGAASDGEAGARVHTRDDIITTGVDEDTSA